MQANHMTHMICKFWAYKIWAHFRPYNHLGRKGPFFENGIIDPHGNNSLADPRINDRTVDDDDDYCMDYSDGVKYKVSDTIPYT